MKTAYKHFLLDQGYDDKSAEAGYSLNKTNEQKLKITSKFSGMRLENIVADDIRMKDALGLIMRFDRPGNERQNALRMYYYFINENWYDGWRPTKVVKTRKQNWNNRVPSSLGEGDMREIYPIYYDPEIAEEDKIPGLISFLLDEYENIICYLDELVSKPIEMGPIIPVILKKEFPSRLYENSDEYIAKKIVKSAMNYSGDNLEKVVLGILKEKKYREKVFGEYHHDGCPEYVVESFGFEDGCRPYIVINYRNINCPDEMDYRAELGHILVLEFFHFLQDLANSEEFASKSDERIAVVEGTADYFATEYSLVMFDKMMAITNKELKALADCLEIEHAEQVDQLRNTLATGNGAQARYMLVIKRYEMWRNRFGSVWPYANALYFFLEGEDCLHSLEDVLMSWNSKFYDVVRLSTKSMLQAYERMIHR